MFKVSSNTSYGKFFHIHPCRRFRSVVFAERYRCRGVEGAVVPGGGQSFSVEEQSDFIGCHSDGENMISPLFCDSCAALADEHFPAAVECGEIDESLTGGIRVTDEKQRCDSFFVHITEMP